MHSQYLIWIEVYLWHAPRVGLFGGVLQQMAQVLVFELFVLQNGAEFVKIYFCILIEGV